MRKTKIICTIGPTASDSETIARLINAGMNISRHNFSHGDHQTHQEQMNRVRTEAKRLNKTVAILQDLRGPEIRTHKFADPPIMLHQGDSIRIISGGKEVLGSNKQFSTTYDKLHLDVEIGSRILVDDGLLALKVDQINDTTITCTVLNDGSISDNKGINLPGILTQLPAVTGRDYEDLKFGVEMGVDIVAASFIRNEDDILSVRKALRSLGGDDIFLIAKIENQDGVENIEKIIHYADGVMVARGDLGVEIPAEEVPLIQKRIIELCNKQGKPVITATQMLESMVFFPRPTRAEVSDIANAIFDGSDCIMLSGETANGKYPVQALETMARIADFAERNIKYDHIMTKNSQYTIDSVQMAISYASVSTAKKIGAAAIISATVSGSTAKNVSRFRPQSPILAITSSEKVARRLVPFWGVFPIVTENYQSTDEMITRTAQIAQDYGFAQEGDLVVITAGLPIKTVGATNMIKIHFIGEALVQGNHTHIVDQLVSGAVKKAANAKEAKGKIWPGDILVVNSLGDDYLDLMESLAGIVVESKYVSPDMIVEAIKRDIPIIAEAENALNILEEGNLITLDSKLSLVIKGRIKFTS